MASTATTASSPTPPPDEPSEGAGAGSLDDALDDALVAPRMLLARAGGAWFGCPLADVREVLPLGALARLPGAPPHVLGLLNVRGRLVTVMDLGRRLAPDAAPGAGGYVLIVAAGERQAGCRVDAVARAVPLGEIHPPTGVGNAGAGGIVMGVGEVDGEPVAVLDLPAFVRDTLVDPGER